VPPEEVELLEGRAVWDDDGGEEWRLLPRSDTRDPVLNKRPVSHPALLRPMSMLTRERARDPQNANNPRYRADNVLTFDLDMPERTTADYETDVNPSVRAALTAALQDDEQLELDTEENLPTMGPTCRRWAPRRAEAAGSRASSPPRGAARRPRRRCARRRRWARPTISTRRSAACWGSTGPSSSSRRTSCPNRAGW